MSAARIVRQFGAPGVTPQSLGIPTAAYPGRVATNSDLIVAVDRQQTSLLVQLNPGDTSMTVLDPSMVVAFSLLSIDNEIVKTTGAPAGNVVPISRGFDGTVPAVHVSGATVQGLIDAYHHNTLAAEIKAIETFLGPNGQSLAAFSPGELLSSQFKFAPQQPGGSLNVGSNVITLAPVPLGVNGADQFHYLYISGGTGTAEAVLITGGTAVAGASSGTLFVTCGNTHSGAWTIGTATSGIYEAIIAGGGAHANVRIASGTNPIYAPMEIGAMHGLRVQGYGIGTTTLDIAHATNDLFTWRSELRDLNLSEFSVTSATVTRTGGWVLRGIGAYTATFLLRRSRVWHIDVKNQFNGFWFTQYELSQLTECWLTGFIGSGGIGIKAGQTAATNLNQGAGLNITDVYVYGSDFIGNNPITLSYGLWIEDCDAVEVNHLEITNTVIRSVHITGSGYGAHNHFFNELVSDACGTGPGFYITGTGTVNTILIDGCWFASAGAIGSNPTAVNFKTDVSAIAALQIRNSAFVLSRGNALRIESPFAQALISGNYFGSCCQSNTAGFLDTIYINTTANNPGPFLTGNADYDIYPAGGYSLRTSATSNLVNLGPNYFNSGMLLGTLPQSGFIGLATTAAIGGSAMTVGQSVSTVTTVPGAAFSMTVVATPIVYPGDGFVWKAYVNAAGSITTILTCLVAGTPAASTYYLRVSN